MLNAAYHQIWRPGPDPRFVTDRGFSSYLTEACDGYAACENELRAALTKAKKHGWSLEQDIPGLYRSLKKSTFEMQEQIQHIFCSNGCKTSRFVPVHDIARLEGPMRLSAYRCSIYVSGSELELQPFKDLAGGRLGDWYLEHAGIFSFSRKHGPTTLFQLIASAAAIRCLLYAQFGPLSEESIRPSRCRGEGLGYYKYQSLFSLTPPDWPEQEWYGFPFSIGASVPAVSYPL